MISWAKLVYYLVSKWGEGCRDAREGRTGPSFFDWPHDNPRPHAHSIIHIQRI